MDLEKAAHDLALAFTVSELNAMTFDDPQSKIEQMLADYCAAYGFVTAKSSDQIEDLIRHGET